MLQDEVCKFVAKKSDRGCPKPAVSTLLKKAAGILNGARAFCQLIPARAASSG